MLVLPDGRFRIAETTPELKVAGPKTALPNRSEPSGKPQVRISWPMTTEAEEPIVTVGRLVRVVVSLRMAASRSALLLTNVATNFSPVLKVTLIEVAPAITC